jgi:AcrR family transcriptional regulator
MSKPVKPTSPIEPKRPYRSDLRRDQAQLTRERILNASEELFLSDGFGATTVTAIAKRAGVATDTVYATFGSKRGILKTLMDVRVVGDDEPVALLDRVGPASAKAESDQNRRVEMVASNIAAIHERTRRIDDLMLSAAGDDHEIATLREDIQQRQRLEGMRKAVSVIQGPDALRPGLTRDQAVDVLWAIAGPDMHRLLRKNRQWEPDQYREWLTDSIHRLLLP